MRTNKLPTVAEYAIVKLKDILVDCHFGSQQIDGPSVPWVHESAVARSDSQ